MIQITQGNFGHAININVVDKAGIPVNLANNTASMDLVFPDKTKKNYSLSVLDAPNGKLQLVITTEMTSQKGKYKGYIDIVSATARITLDTILEYTVLLADGGVA